MDLITQTLKRTAGGGPLPTNKNFYTASWVTDNSNDKTVFGFYKYESLTVPPYSSNQTFKFAETTGFSNAIDDWTGFTHAFVPQNWGSGNYHTQTEVWEVSKAIAPISGSFAANPNRSIIVAYDGGAKTKVSTDLGTTWVDGTTTLPGLSLSSVTYADGYFYVIYGNNQGVWRSADGMTWVNYGGIFNQMYALKTGAPNYTLIGHNIYGSTDYFYAFARTEAGGSTNYVLEGMWSKPYDGNRTVMFTTKTVNQVQQNDGILILSDRVYSVTWNGTNPVASQVYTIAAGSMILTMCWDEINNRYLALFVSTANWGQNNEIRASSDNGATWTLVEAVPSAYSNRFFILALANGKIVLSGNAGGDSIYSPDTDTWAEGGAFKMQASLRLSETRFITTSYNLTNSTTSTYISDTAPANNTTPMYSKREWFTYTWANITSTPVYSISSDTLRTSVNTNVTFNGTKDFLFDRGRYPSYFSANTATPTNTFAGGLNYDTENYFVGLEAYSITNYSQNLPQYVSNIWKSSDNGNTYTLDADFTQYATGVNTNHPLLATSGTVSNWIPGTTSFDDSAQLSYSRLLWNPVENLNKKYSSFSPAGLNDIIYQDGAFWAWGHNGVLMTSTTGNSGWKKFDNLQKMCFGTRITAFAKNGNNLVVFTNLYPVQCFYSTDLGVTWIDSTTTFRTAMGASSASGWNVVTASSNQVTSCIWDGTQFVAAALNGTGSVIVSATGATWTKKNPTNLASYIPVTITKHPSTSTVLIGCKNGVIYVTDTNYTTGTAVTLSTYGFGTAEVSKIIWNGTTWFAFFENGSSGRYTYSTTAIPNTLASWKNPTNTTDFPATRQFGGASSTLNGSYVCWDGTNLLLIDYYNRRAFKSATGENWTEMVWLYDWNNLWYKFAKHPAAIASNGTTYVVVGDMCDSAHTTDGGSSWSTNAGTKSVAGVEDPACTVSMETYIDQFLTITNGGTGYPANQNIVGSVTVTFSNPTGSPGVKPVASSVMTNASGAISSITVSNYLSVTGYGSTAPTVTISGSTGSGATATTRLLYKVGSIRFTNLGKGFGTTYSSINSSYRHDSFEVGVIQSQWSIVNFNMGVPGVSLNNVATPLLFYMGNKKGLTGGGYSGSNMMFGNDSGSLVIYRGGSNFVVNNLNYTTLRNYALSGYKTTGNFSYKIGSGAWKSEEIRPIRTKQCIDNSGVLVDNRTAPIVAFGNDYYAWTNNVIIPGTWPETLNLAIFHTGAKFEYNSANSTLSVSPIAYRSGFTAYNYFIKDTSTNVFAGFPSALTLNLSGTNLTNYQTNSTLQISQPFVQMVGNGGNERNPGNTLVVVTYAPKVFSNMMWSDQYPTDINGWYWLKSTDGGTTWTDISAPIRTKFAAEGLTYTPGSQYTFPYTIMYSWHEKMWYAPTGNHYIWWSSDLVTWTVTRDPVSLYPTYPN